MEYVQNTLALEVNKECKCEQRNTLASVEGLMSIMKDKWFSVASPKNIFVWSYEIMRMCEMIYVADVNLHEYWLRDWSMNNMNAQEILNTFWRGRKA